MEELQEWVERHKYHIKKLEVREGDCIIKHSSNDITTLQKYLSLALGVCIGVFLMSQTIMRLLDNCSLEADKVKAIMDDLNYYLDCNQVITESC